MDPKGLHSSHLISRLIDIRDPDLPSVKPADCVQCRGGGCESEQGMAGLVHPPQVPVQVEEVHVARQAV